ncbi:MAG: carboxypeptidase regulatory-like domain-containing protein [Patescibacteria group bacterium]|nr:carboxypeptidase regulatory-like domain-containing protein [Patescibacteria group bacterium]
MESQKSKIKNQKLKGFTLVEVLVGVALMVIIFLGLYSAFQLGLKVVGNSKAQATAIALANQKIEQVRNLSYKDIGTIGGIPSGVLPQTEEIYRNAVSYAIKTTVLYIDDPFDGLAPTDTLSTDYKRAKIKVSWSGYFGGEVTLITDIAPKGVETEAGGGTLKISVFNASGIGVAQADIHIINSQILPVIDTTYQSDDSGNLIIAGAPTSTEAYQITVSKPGFSQDRTYGRDEIANPLKPHISVFEGQVTEISFSIDELSALLIESRSRESFDDDFGNWSKISEYSNISLSKGEVKLAETNGDYQSSGYLVSIEISPPNLINWDNFRWQDLEPELTEIKYQILYATGTSFELIPDEDLPGNSQGFSISPVDISSLDIQKYSSLKIKGNLSTDSGSASPVLYDWHLIYNTPLIGNVDFWLAGSKIIGTDKNDKPVLKYSMTKSSDSTGKINISSLEWDSYTFSATTTTLMDLVETIPSPQPIDLLPAIITKVNLYFKAENTLLVKVKDATTSEPIFATNVRIYNEDLGYDNSKPTDKNGQAFFIPLRAVTYNLEIWANEYQMATTTVSVSGGTTKTISLEKL